MIYRVQDVANWTVEIATPNIPSCMREYKSTKRRILYELQDIERWTKTKALHYFPEQLLSYVPDRWTLAIFFSLLS